MSINFSNTPEGKAQSERLINCRIALGHKNAYDFYLAYGQNGDAFSYPAWQKYESGERLLSAKAAVKFATILNKDADWLRFGDVTDNSVKIDVLNVQACCGNGLENFTENVIGQHIMTLPALREFTAAAPENIKIIKAVGESMLPTVAPNDMVWIDISVKTPTSDGLYVLAVGETLMIKRIQISPLNNSAIVTSDNPAYQPFNFPHYSDIKVVGQVI